MRKRVALPAAIKAIRELKAEADEGYRLRTFSIANGMTPGHLCNIEAGRKSATAEVISRLALSLGVSVDAISYEVDALADAAA